MSSNILIIGAGPVGLSLACDLTRRGINCQIVEKNKEISQYSKALGIHAGTLQCFESTLGREFCQGLINASRKVKHAHIQIYGKKEVTINFTGIPEPYPFILMLEQYKTEKLLEDYLEAKGKKVLRGIEVEELIESKNSVNVSFSNGSQQAFDFVVGCEGAHSLTRHKMEVGFRGEEYQALFSLADLYVNWDRPPDVHVFIEHHGLVVFFPFQEANRYRVIAVAREEKAAKGELSFDEFKNELREIGFHAPELSKPVWITNFKVHHRLVKKFQQGRLFLAGDAAHIHSPIGGQGMNIGIHDALNLANKFYLYEQGDKKILNKYSDERIAVAQKIVRGTDFLTKTALKKETAFNQFFTRHIFPNVASLPLLQKTISRKISQVDLVKDEITKYV